MYVRMNTIFGESGKVASALTYLEDRDRPLVEATLGNDGLVTYVDWDNGVVVAASYWDEPLRSREAALTEVRHDAGWASAGAVTAGNFEVTGAVRPLTVTVRNAVVCLSSLQLEAPRIDEAIDFLNKEALTALSCCTNLYEAEVLVDSSSSRAIVYTVWANDHAADGGCFTLEGLRYRALDQAPRSWASNATP